MKKKIAIVFICLIGAGAVVQAQTIYETFDTNPQVRGWVNESSGSSLFAYNSDGYVDVLEIHRDSANMARFWKLLDSPINDAQEFWFEVDLVLLDSSNSALQTSHLGVFGNASSNTTSFVGTRFAYDNYNGSPRGLRFDMYGYDASGSSVKPGNTVLDATDGLPYNVAARLKMHYFNDNGQKKLSFSIYDIPETKTLFMHADEAEILPAATTTILNCIGVGNRTDGAFWSTFQALKFDNVYFSTEGPNSNPVPPSFGYFTFPGDFNKDGRVNLEDFVVLSSNWMGACIFPGWCDNSDVNTDGAVDVADLKGHTRDWLLRSVSAELKLHGLFGNNMVMQRDSVVPVWGWAEPGQTITVTGNWNQQSVSATVGAQGTWNAAVETPPAGGPYELHVSGGNKTIVINNVMMGDVWVCSGQSNMAFTLDRVINGPQEVADADHPNIRLMAPIKLATDVPQENVDGAWLECSPASVSTFSGVGYYFCLNLKQNLNIPIGLIEITRGGYPIAPFMSRQALLSDPDFATQLARDTASELYNGWVAPISNFPIKGVIWYQGESDHGRGWLYRKLFPALINDWRSAWGLGNLPFYYCQIAPYSDYGGNAKSAELREAQFMTLSVPNTGMVVTHDTVTDLTDIHPPDKKPVGQRLANWALANTYGFSGIVYSGLLYKSMDIEGSRIRIHFDHVGSGLMVQGSGDLTDFTIAGSDQVFYSASAAIDGDTVVVSSPSVPQPVSVRFGWSNVAQPNLFNAEGLPASSFRTDDWPGETYTAR